MAIIHAQAHTHASNTATYTLAQGSHRVALIAVVVRVTAMPRLYLVFHVNPYGFQTCVMGSACLVRKPAEEGWSRANREGREPETEVWCYYEIFASFGWGRGKKSHHQVGLYSASRGRVHIMHVWCKCSRLESQDATSELFRPSPPGSYGARGAEHEARSTGVHA
jgi:hypothetical protein